VSPFYTATSCGAKPAWPLTGGLNGIFKIVFPSFTPSPAFWASFILVILLRPNPLYVLAPKAPPLVTVAAPVPAATSLTYTALRYSEFRPAGLD